MLRQDGMLPSISVYDMRTSQIIEEPADASTPDDAVKALVDLASTVIVSFFGTAGLQYV